MSLFKSHQRILEEALPFQGDLVHLLEEPLPKGIRGTIHCCILMFFIGLAVSIICKVDVVVTGRGKLTYDAPPIVLQAYERSVLKTLHVRPGQKVNKGDVLATLDPTILQADISAQKNRLEQIHAQLERIKSETTGKAFVIDQIIEEKGIKIWQLQLDIYQQRMNEFAAREKGFDEQISEAKASLARTEAEQTTLKEQLVIAKDIEIKQEKLFLNKTSSELEYLTAKNNRLQVERNYQTAINQTVELGHRIQALESQKSGFVQEWKRNLFEESVKLQTEEAQIRAVMVKSSTIESFVKIIAPEDGVVLEVASRSVGSVIRDTEPIVILVPSSAPLLCEVELSSADIGDIRFGKPVIVKVDAFPFQRFGGLEGNLRSIAYDSHQMGNAPGDIETMARKSNVAAGGAHRAVIELTTFKLKNQPEGTVLFPGMTVAGEVHVGNRRLIEYLLWPLIRGLMESFRES